MKRHKIGSAYHLVLEDDVGGDLSFDNLIEYGHLFFLRFLRFQDFLILAVHFINNNKESQNVAKGGIDVQKWRALEAQADLPGYI
jgi:hypothetical protein